MDHELKLVIQTNSDLQATGTLGRVKQACAETGAVVIEATFDPPVGATAEVSGQRPPEEPRFPPPPQLTEERLPGETEADFSARMARIQASRLETQKAITDARERDPLAPFKHVFGS